MASAKRSIPVLIIGGGPAGVATSLTLSARGIPHAIAEARAEPIRKPGEALPPNAKPLLRQLGILHLLRDKAHLPYYGNQSTWQGSPLRSENFISDVNGHGYLLDRLLFETQLQKLLKAPFYKGYRLKSILKNRKGAEVRIESQENSLCFQARYVVDATGRKASVCRHLGVKSQVLDEWFALWFIIDAEATGQIFVESTEDGWWYAAPYGEKQLTLMFFTRQGDIPPKPDIPAFLAHKFGNTLQLSKMFSPRLHGMKEVRIMPSGTSRLEMPYGQNWLATGDAAYAYDPISSFGITSALAGGYYAGHALADTLSGKADALRVYHYIMENAFQAFREKLEILHH